MCPNLFFSCYSFSLKLCRLSIAPTFNRPLESWVNHGTHKHTIAQYNIESSFRNQPASSRTRLRASNLISLGYIGFTCLWASDLFRCLTSNTQLHSPTFPHPQTHPDNVMMLDWHMLYINQTPPPPPSDQQSQKASGLINTAVAI